MERGKYYYIHKHVQGLRYKDYIYKAQVIGSYIYQVEIKIRNQEPGTRIYDVFLSSCSKRKLL